MQIFLKNSPHRRIFSYLGAALFFGALSSAQSQTIYDWLDTAPDGNWTQGATGARWNPGGLWNEPPPGNVLRFNNNQKIEMTNNVAGTYNLNGIIFGSSGTTARTISGNDIRFFDSGGADPYIANDSSATHVLNLNIQGDGDAVDPLLININSSGGLTFNGTINNQGSTVNVQGSTAVANTTVTMNGAISGTGGLYKNNVNTTLVLAGNNNYSGQTTIEGGTISITNANSLGSGTLQIGAAGAYSRLLVNSNSSRSGALTIQANATSAVIEVASGQTFTNSGTLSGTGINTKFGKHGSGTLILSGSGSTYAGQMQIGGGTVILGQSGSFGNSTSTSTRGIDLGLYVDDVNSSENVSLLASNGVTVSNSIYVAPNGGSRTIGLSGSGTNTFSKELFLGGNLTVNASATSDRVNISGPMISTGQIIKTGSGTLALSGSNTFSGKVTVGAGTLIATGVSDTVGSGLGMGTQVELGSGANLQVTVGAGTTNTTTRALILNGSGTLGASTGTLVWNGNVTNNGTAASTFFFNSPAAGTNVFGGIIGNTTNNSAVGLTFQATQIWSLTGSNTFSGGITIGGGKVIADKLANIGTASSIGTAASVRFGYFDNARTTFEYVGSGSTNNMQVKLGANSGSINNAASFLHNGTGALVLTNAAFTLTGDGGSPVANRVLVLGGTNAADNTITGIIGNSGANTTLSIVKADAGKWILSGNNTYAGGTTISNGIFQIGAGGTSGSVLGAIANNGSLIFNRSDATTVTNAISGSGSVTKNAANTLTLSGANTFSGNVTIGGGTLAVTSVADSGASSLGTGTQLTLGGSATASFTANSSNNTTRSLVLGGTGGNALKNSGSGALVWSGNVINNTTANGADFTLGGSGTGGNEFSGLLTNNGANTMRLIKTETGTWKVSGANTFTSLLDVFNGTLVVTTMANSGTASSVGAGTTIRFGGFAGETGVLEYVGSGSTNNKQFKLGGGGTANTGGTILNNGTGALEFNNTTFNAAGDALPASSARALTLSGTNAADNTISGVIQNNNANNTVSIVKDGVGKWILSGANTYTGGTTISNGIFQIGVGGTLASSGITVSGGTFETTAANTVADTSTVNISSGTYSIGGNDTVASLTVSGGLLSTANSSTLTATTYALNGGTVSANLGAGTVNASSGTTLLSGTSGAANVNVSGGLLSLVSANRLSDTAAVAVSSGELAVGGNDTVASLTVSGGLLSSANNSTLTATTYALNGGTVSANLGAGTVNSSSGTTLLSGTSAAANVNVSGGTLNTSGANKLADGAAVAVSSGTLGLGGSDTVGSLAASGTGVVTVASSTTLTANGNSSITGSARATGGTVAIANNSNLTLANSSTTTTSDLSIGSGSTLAGSGGTSGQIKGSGLLSPGNSPGILTSGSVDLTGGIDFAFEFTAGGAPTYSMATNSKNDLLHLTSGSTPFSGSFSADNTVSFYFNDAGLSASLASVTPTTYLGGFFVDTQNFNIAGLLSSATLQYFIAAANGTTSFNGVNYDLVSNEVASRMILSNVNQSAADFTTGTVSGTVLGVMAVPEPSSGSLLLAGIASLLVLRRFRKKA